MTDGKINCFKDESSKLIDSMVASYDKMIDHYTFVIADISSTIYNPELERTKAPVIKFLKEMKSVWEKCRDDVLKNK